MAVLTWLWMIVKGAFNAFAKAVVFIVMLVLVLVLVGVFSGDGLHRNMVLVLDLRESLEDKSAPSLLELTASKISVMDIVFGLDAAQRDNRVKGVFVRVGSGDLSVPQAEEVRDALKRLRAAGKFVIAHSQTFYSGGLGDYQVAAAADEIWMQPASAFFSAGTSSSTLFLRGLFDKVHAVPQIAQRREYKNAANVLTETDYTPAHREATTRVLESWYETATGEIAADRRLARNDVTAVLDASPSTADEVKAKGLITAIGYDDDASNAAKKRAGADARLTPFADYVHNHPVRPRRGGPVVALVHAAGDIVEGDDEASLTSGATSIAGDTFAQAVREATRDSAVKAIVLRVDSPGGSAIASDQILDALKKARAAGKPIVVSMGSVAASGGYYIALAADRIVAQPATLTGSIGVIFGKVAVGDSLAMVGVNGRELTVGRNAGFISALKPWDAEQLAEVEVQADVVYDDFTRKVAEGRHMPLDRVQDLARGRVWTGADAKERGLVDELGGFWTAVAAAKRLAGIAPETSIAFRDFPRDGGFVHRVSEIFDSSAASLSAVRGLNAVLSSPLVRTVLAAAGDAPNGQAQLKAVGLPH
jgi:protease-4